MQTAPLEICLIWFELILHDKESIEFSSKFIFVMDGLSKSTVPSGAEAKLMVCSEFVNERSVLPSFHQQTHTQS